MTLNLVCQISSSKTLGHKKLAILLSIFKLYPSSSVGTKSEIFFATFFFGVGRNSSGQQSRPANLANMKCMTEGARLYDVLGL